MTGPYVSVHFLLRAGMTALDTIRRQGGRIGPSLICADHGVIHILTNPGQALTWTRVPGVLRATDTTTNCGQHWRTRLWVVPHDAGYDARTDPESLRSALIHSQKGSS